MAEPGGGGYTNFPGTWNTQDDYTHNYSDIYYYSLCGPGAVDTALYYWPYPPNYANYTNVYDPMLSPSPYSSWKGQDIDGTERMRGYLLHLAYTIKAPTWSKSGMLPQTLYQTTHPGGATLQTVRDGLNWEASNENTSTWSSYFYVTQWNSAYYSTNRNVYPANLYDALHNDIVTDLAFSHVPMIVEVTAGYLPNWPSSNGVNHFIAIVGYNDTAGTYTYMDTCKEYTNCNPGGIDTPDAHTIDQLQLSEGVANIGTNTTQGDGGWVW